MEDTWQERGIRILVDNLMTKFNLTKEDLEYNLYDEQVEASAHWLRLGDGWGMNEWQLQNSDSDVADLEHRRELLSANDQGNLLLDSNFKKFALVFEPMDDSEKTYPFFDALKEKCRGDVLLDGVDELGKPADSGIISLKADSLDSIGRTLMRVAKEIQGPASRFTS